MITQKDAEKLATEKIQEYVNACGCMNTDDVGNVLMKMISVTGQAILATQGQDKAVAIIKGTAKHIAKPQFKNDYKQEPVH
jgi:hypothetical protein